jgi:hypothetical protein
LRTYNVCKAEQVNSRESVEDTAIYVTLMIPNDLPQLADLDHLYNRDADLLADALAGSLPQATLQRLIGVLMRRHASYYRGV